MNIAAFIQPQRMRLPCTGVGRHANGVLAALASVPGVDLELLFGPEQRDGDGGLPHSVPLRHLRARALPFNSRLLEKSWKLLGRPHLDRWLGDGIAWVYAPLDTRLPVRRVPAAITVHDARAFEPPRADGPRSLRADLVDARMRMWLHRAMAEAEIVFTVSQHARGKLIELAGVMPHKVVVSGNGLDPELIASAERAATPRPLSQDGERPYALVIGGLRAIKGGRHVVDAARLLKARGSALSIVIVGAPSDPALLAEASALGNVTHLGMVSDSELRRRLGGADALLFLSLYEGFGIPVLEAMALGVPVVAADRTALPEVAGDAALLVAPEDSDAVVEALALATSDSAGRRALIERGFCHARGFTWQAVARRVHDAMRVRS